MVYPEPRLDRRKAVFCPAVEVAMANAAPGVVVPTPMPNPPDMVLVAVPVPRLMSLPFTKRSPEKRLSPMTESGCLGLGVPMPRRLFVSSKNKEVLSWRKTLPSEKITDPAVNSDVLIEPPVSVSPFAEAKPPPATLKPADAHVEVADEVLVIDPPVRVSPFDENNPPCPASTIPLENVLVAELVCRRELPVRVRPPDEKRPPGPA